MQKIKLSALVLFGIMAFYAQAQYSVSLSYAPSFPMTRYNGEMKMSIAGANLKLHKHVDDYLWLNLSTGYYMIPFESLNVGGVQKAADVTLNVIPATVGAQFFFSADKIRPYFALDLGYAMTMQGESEYEKATNRNNFIFAPALGVFYNLSDALNLNLGVRNNTIIYRYRDNEDYNQVFQLIGVDLGINYKF